MGCFAVSEGFGAFALEPLHPADHGEDEWPVAGWRVGEGVEECFFEAFDVVPSVWGDSACGAF